MHLERKSVHPSSTSTTRPSGCAAGIMHGRPVWQAVHLGVHEFYQWAFQAAVSQAACMSWPVCIVQV